MGYLQIQVVTLLIAFSVGMPATAGNGGSVKEFRDYQCRMVLPGPQFQWLDHNPIANAHAALGDDSGTILTFLVHKAPDDFVFDDTFIRGFDESFQQPGQISKIGGGMMTFKAIPCYQVHARIEERGRFVTNRCFAANGYVYILQLTSREIPATGSNLEGVFSAFEFIGTPVLPKPRALDQSRAHRTGYLIGRLTFYLVLAIVVLWIVKRVAHRKVRAGDHSP